MQKLPSLVQRVIRSMEKIAPLSLADSSWDNVGLLLEAPIARPNASRVLLTIDLTQDVLAEAIADPAIGVIVAYHPFLFKPVKRLVLSEDKPNIALHCAMHGISVFSPHTALDNCVGGINDWLTRSFGKGRAVPISSASNAPPGHEGAGAGRLFFLETPMSLDDVVSRVKEFLQLPYLRVAKISAHGTSRNVTTIAVCAGSGSSVLQNVKADVYLTGEMSHHDILAAVAQNTSVILCEHSNSERGYLNEVLKARLLSSLKVDLGLGVEADVNIDVVCSAVDRDPLQLA